MFRTSRYEVDDQSFALGFATNSPYNLQGFHSPNLLVVITEAHAVDQDDMDAIRRLNPLRLLMTGNPFINAGVFYDSHHSHRHLYETVQIGAFDTPNVKLGTVAVPLWAATEAAKRELTPEGPIVLGCDVARFGHDRTVVVRRQGRELVVLCQPVGRGVVGHAGQIPVRRARYRRRPGFDRPGIEPQVLV